MSFIINFFGNKNEKEANCCRVQIVEVSDREETVCCDTENSKDQNKCCV